MKEEKLISPLDALVASSCHVDVSMIDDIMTAMHPNGNVCSNFEFLESKNLKFENYTNRPKELIECNSEIRHIGPPENPTPEGPLIKLSSLAQHDELTKIDNIYLEGQ